MYNVELYENGIRIFCDTGYSSESEAEYWARLIARSKGLKYHSIRTSLAEKREKTEKTRKTHQYA